jgi:hypothetical protein
VYVKSALAGSNFFVQTYNGFSNRRLRQFRPKNRLLSQCQTHQLWAHSRKNIEYPQGLIVDDVKLPSAATRAIRSYATLRKKADEEDRRAARAARRAVRVLRTGKLKMSTRDAARLLGLSHQRVHQLTQAKTSARWHHRFSEPSHADSHTASR